MHIILGGTGQVGSATARALLDQGEEVTIVTRDATHGAALKSAGAKIAAADLRDVDALRAIFCGGKRAFLLNPPADPSTDTDTEERRNITAILEALKGSGLEKIVAQSTYGAFAGERCGDLTVLYAFERALLAGPIPAAINRGAYYMTNWTAMAESVRDSGVLPSFFPADLSLPMVAPADLGAAAARRLLSSVADVGIRHVEGPERYSAQDVAIAFAEALHRAVSVAVIPRGELEETFRRFGFSAQAAASYACMTKRLIDGKTDTASEPDKGKLSLAAFIASVGGGER